jgi:hypothetical protein
MIPDNIQANIMKYLNNSVSGSSQPQKPIVSNASYTQNYKYFLLSNSYKTDDNYYIVNMGMYKEGSNDSVPRIGIFTIEDATNGNYKEMLEIPDIGEYKAYTTGKTILRDEEGRFYAIIQYKKPNTEDYRKYFIIFNDFLTDGILLINYSFQLNQTFTIDGTVVGTAYFEGAIKHGSDYYLTDPTSTLMLIGKLTINVGSDNEVKMYYKSNFKSSSDSNTTINSTGDSVYGLINYDYNNIHRIAKITFPEDNNESTQELNTKVLYSWDSRIGNSVDYDIANNNGNYIRKLYYSKDSSNKYTIKYVMVRADETIQEMNLPFTFVTDVSIALVVVNYTIFENLIFARIVGGETDVKYLFRINTNSITIANELNIDDVNFYRFEVLKQFNLWYCWEFRPFTNNSKVFVVKDVPTYGRDCLLKQKFLNSKLFRVIKFKRNK